LGGSGKVIVNSNENPLDVGINEDMNRTGFTPGKTRFEDYDELHGSKIPDKIFGQSTSRSN
jgi:hypothetical protein